MNRDRLIVLRDYLRGHVQDDRFDLTMWVGGNETPWRGMEDLSCGTSACAMGWATTIPEFKALGLVLNSIERKGLDDEPTGLYSGVIAYEGEEQFAAAAKFMDISNYDAEQMFSPEAYDNGERTTREQVIDRLVKFIDQPVSQDTHWIAP